MLVSKPSIFLVISLVVLLQLDLAVGQRRGRGRGTFYRHGDHFDRADGRPTNLDRSDLRRHGDHFHKRPSELLLNYLQGFMDWLMGNLRRKMNRAAARRGARGARGAWGSAPNPVGAPPQTPFPGGAPSGVWGGAPNGVWGGAPAG